MRMSILRPAAALAHSLVLGLALAGPLAGQSMSVVTEGVLAPCARTHFEPEQYLTELADAGWLPVPDDALPIAAEMLAHAFLPVTHPQGAGRSDTVARRIDQAAEGWAEQFSGRAVLMLYDSVLLIGGATDSDGTQILDCWLVTPDGDFVDSLIAEADAEAAGTAEGGIAAAFGPDLLEPDMALELVATRQPAPQGTAHGLHTRLVHLTEE